MAQEKEKQEIIVHLAQKEFDALKKLQDSLCGCIKKFDENINVFEDSFKTFLNEKIGVWWKSIKVCLLICLIVNVPGVAIALIFNDYISIDDTAIYCLTAICIVCIIGCIISIIGCIIVFNNFIQNKRLECKDS
jgi:ABC-type spermidine/putrescine transport system permease subunit I